MDNQTGLALRTCPFNSIRNSFFPHVRQFTGRSGIIGGGAGRGGASQAIARKLTLDGGRIMLVDIDPAVLDFANELRRWDPAPDSGGNVYAVVGNVADPAVAKRAVNECIRRFGILDFVINVADGNDPIVPAMRAVTKSNHYGLQLEKNLIAASNLTTAALPALKRNEGRRDIIFFSTTNDPPGWSWVGEPMLATTKAAMEAPTLILASELRVHAIAVNCVCLASIPNPHSPEWAAQLANPDVQARMRERYRLGGPLTAEHVATEVAHLLDPKVVRTGQVIVLDPGGLSELGP